MSDLAIVGVTGLQGSGKTEVSKVAASLGFSGVRMGDLVWEETRRRGLELNEANVGVISQELRREEGPAAIAKRCIPIIEKRGEGKKAVLVDGIRSMAEVDEFRREFGNRFYLLATWAREQIRYRRVAARGREDDATSLKTFREKDARELEWGLGKTIALADFILINEGAMEEFHRKVGEILKKIKSGEGVAEVESRS